MLVSELIDRTYNEWLWPAGVDRPAFDTLSGNIDATTTSITLGGRLNKVPNDSVIEIGSELVLLSSTAGSVLTAAQRGYLNTTGAPHYSGDLVFVDPKFPRLTMLNALIAVVGMLGPWGLYWRKTTTSTIDRSAVVALPTGGKKILSILERSLGTDETYRRLKPGQDWMVFEEFTPAKYQLLNGAEGASITIVYTTDFTAPTAESEDITTYSGVPATLAPFLPLAVAGYALQGREIPRVAVEEIRRNLATQGIQVGTALNIGQQLLGFFKNIYVAAERRRQSELDPLGFEWARR